MKVAPLDQFEKPRQRKGFTLTSVAWDPETGRIRSAKYEPIVRVRAEPAPLQVEPAARPRGVVAASQGQLL